MSNGQDDRRQDTIPVLPPVDATNLPGSTRGAWESDNESYIRKVAEAIVVTSEQGSVEKTTAIPDVWAQVTGFTNAFINTEHPNHKNAIAQWRGLLALLALTEHNELQTTIHTISLSALAARPHLLYVEDNHANFAVVLKAIVPGEILSAYHSWEEIGLIYPGEQEMDKEKPIGLLVPTTLVCPAADPTAALQGAVAWLKEGLFCDPCDSRACPNITLPELGALAAYLNNLIAGMTSDSHNQPDAPFNNDLARPLFGQLQVFLSEVRNRLEAMKIASIRPQDNQDWERAFSCASAGFSLPRQSCYGHLGEVPIIESVDPDNILSDTILPARPDFSDTVNAVIIDKNLSSQWGRPDHDIQIWNFYNLDRLHRAQGVKQERLREQIIRAGYAPLDTQTFFTDYLVHIRNNEIEGHHQDFSEFLLPLRPRVLFFIKPEELVDNVRPRLRCNREKNGYRVTLTLSLHSTTGEPRDYRTSKFYKDDMVIETNEPSTTSLWPDFQSRYWDRYFLYYSGNPTVQVTYQNPFVAGIIKKQLEDTPSKRERIELAFRDDHSEIISRRASRMTLDNSPTVVRELLQLDSPPEALICRISVGDQQSGNTKLGGMVILPQLREAPFNQNPWSVGVDFGTTNTSLYLREGNFTPREVIFQSRHVVPYRTILREVNEELDRELIPMVPIPIPFLSMLKDRQKQVRDDKPLLSTRIYYVSDTASSLDSVSATGGMSQRIHYNLKWSPEQASRILARRFLGQIVMQTLAEIVSQGGNPRDVSWRYSYPSAFHSDHLQEFRNIFELAIKDVVLPVKRDDPVNDSWTPQIELRTESICAGLYFKKEHENVFAGTVVTIDIGGRTSDVTIWQKKDLIWQNSFTFGGKDILIQFLKHNINMVEQILDPNHQILADYVKKLSNNKDYLECALEILVNSRELRMGFSDHFTSVAQTTEPKAFRILSELSLAGLMYYLGVVITYLVKNDLFDPKSVPFNIYLGGRGSLAYQSLQLDLNKMSMLLKDRVGITSEVNVSFSPKMKHEVAYGLLVRPDGLAGKLARSQNAVWGEQVKVGTEIRNPFEAFKEEDVEREWKIEADQMKALSHFLQEFNRRFSSTILYQDLLPHVASTVTEQLTEERERLETEYRSRRTFSQDPEDPMVMPTLSEDEMNSLVKVQPAFTIALRHFTKLGLEKGIFIDAAERSIKAGQGY